MKPGDKVRLKPSVADSAKWREYVGAWGEGGSVHTSLIRFGVGGVAEVLEYLDADRPQARISIGGMKSGMWVPAKWLEPAEDEADTFAPVQRKRSAWIDLTPQQIAALVASSLRVKPKEGTLGCTTLFENGLFKGVTVRWEEEA